MGKCILSLLVLVGVCAVGYSQFNSSPPESSDKTPAASVEQSDFQGKFILIGTRDTNAGEYLQEAELTKVGDRYFIKGKVVLTPKEDNVWRREATVLVAWDRIATIYIYTPEEWKKAFDATAKVE